MKTRQHLPPPAPAGSRCSKTLLRFAPFILVALVVMTATASAQAQAKKPNILVIFGDDIGVSNISAYSRGLMGFTTPNIDRIGNEGGVLVNYYGQQSCTAGRAAFILGQCPFRTGLTKVGMPGAPVGIQQEEDRKSVV